MKWLVLAVTLVACQPWYRDSARRGQAVLDPRAAAAELRAAKAARAARDYSRCADILQRTVRRSPASEGEVWPELVECELAAGDVTRARAHARWRLARAANDPATTRLRNALVESLARDGLIAQALDFVEPPTLEAALAHPGLAAKLRDVEYAMRRARWPNMIRLGAQDWLDRYGEPDHPILHAARERLAAGMWTGGEALGAPTELVELHRWPALIREELQSGDLPGALVLYARARALLPTPVTDSLRVDVERAAATAGITALFPDVHALAREGDQALQAGKLGDAIARYRLVVARSPWWPAARANLEAMLALDRRSK